ncbi:MAG: hypothetical protein M3Z06_05200, partial [Actinomycetota bacterium]|nr:hypothetical protein [Actinomycetota bacterium]
RVVGPVGDDFGDDEIAVLADRGVQTADIERVAGGKTFFWKGVLTASNAIEPTTVTDMGPRLVDHLGSRRAERNPDPLALRV